MLRDRRAVLRENRGGRFHSGHLLGGHLRHESIPPLNIRKRYIFMGARPAVKLSHLATTGPRLQ
ncbi:hypothetical protein A8H37_22745 [Burkholderia thailandensis]|nr:hypothetical protein A8H37_22745 [Burkholderia thailandensis]